MIIQAVYSAASGDRRVGNYPARFAPAEKGSGFEHTCTKPKYAAQTKARGQEQGLSEDVLILHGDRRYHRSAVHSPGVYQQKPEPELSEDIDQDSGGRILLC